MSPKSPVTAFLLSFIPGAGHLYLNRPIRAFLYAGGFFGPLFIIFVSVISRSRFPKEMLLFCLFVAFAVAAINVLDMIITLLRDKREQAVGVRSMYGESFAQPHPSMEYGYDTASEPYVHEREQRMLGMPYELQRLRIILLSFIPGLGHFQLGLMQRGLIFLTGYFGTMVMVLFVCFLLSSGKFLVFLGALPIIWLYGLFDALQLLARKMRGEELVDRSIFEDFQESRADGRKNKMVATILSVFPGAGHMYLGLQRRGLQLMAAFLLGIYILDVLHLSLFLFMIPIIWFYSFFDALQMASKVGREELKDTPVVDWFVNHQKWVGIVLLALGAYYLLDEALLGIIEKLLPKQNISFWFHKYFQTFIVSVLLIGGGIKLLLGSNKHRGRGSE
ncbi:hypothetical protein [Paenibacillus thalictri]|uniref:Multi-tm2 domain protein n=1 Tax=Paenibacillus thalictri TaxID=2527873 RepID=A0A4Q9DI56_9BACL|nr:hypothetical protein [Paenibacillus thalictri]TBL72932.1 hypothetical protein EYB31_27250 [Paenibacillus thalictri]